jgi:hypothetical protein
MRARRTHVAIALAIAGHAATAAWANEASRAKAAESMAICEGAERLPASKKAEKLQRLSEGLKLAEAAVAADDLDGRAHLAVVCNLGQQLNTSGLSWRVFGQVRRLQDEIDRAHELSPDDPDVLAAKGQILRELPGPLGGNRDAGTKLLARAVQVAPDHVPARLYHARAMAADRAPDARKSCYEALALAKKRGAAREESQAQQLIASLRD